MDCTGETRRERISKEYNIEVVGCYKLFGGQTIRSDAGGKIIVDRYYLFLCVHKTTHQEETIRCGQPTARHLCELSGNLLPTEFNPFQEEHGEAREGGGGNGEAMRWHRSRKQLYNAIMLFITRYGETLKPGSPIFQIKTRVESNVGEPVEVRDVFAVNTILGGYKITMSRILQDLARAGVIRNFTFDILEQILVERNKDVNNFG